MRNRIVEIAKAEIGYREAAGNSNKYSKELYGKEQEWCNDFICWCAMKAGIGTNIIPRYSYVPYTANWFNAENLYKNSQAYGGNYIPVSGDIILFDYNRNATSDHIGIVEKIEEGQVHTIEGNKDNMVKRCSYYLNNKYIRAYGVPKYDNQKLFGIVNSKIGLNIRKSPSTNKEIIMAIKSKDKVEIIEKNVVISNGYVWDKVMYKEVIGYVANKYLTYYGKSE